MRSGHIREADLGAVHLKCKRGHVCTSEKFKETVQPTVRGGRHFGMDFSRNLSLNPECEPFVPKSALNN